MPEQTLAPACERTERIANLNDRCRNGLDRTARMLITRGCLFAIQTSQDPIDTMIAQSRIVSAVRKVEFTQSSPERDMAWFTLDGHDLMMVISYYDLDLQFHSEDEADPEKTRRVMTIMLTSEY